MLHIDTLHRYISNSKQSLSINLIIHRCLPQFPFFARNPFTVLSSPSPPAFLHISIYTSSTIGSRRHHVRHDVPPCCTTHQRTQTFSTPHTSRNPLSSNLFCYVFFAIAFSFFLVQHDSHKKKTAFDEHLLYCIDDNRFFFVSTFEIKNTNDIVS